MSTHFRSGFRLFVYPVTSVIASLLIGVAIAKSVEPAVRVIPLPDPLLLTLEPSKEASGAGAMTLKTLVFTPGSSWMDSFTGFGCTPGPFADAKVQFDSCPDGTHSFSIVSRTKGPADAPATIEWKGVLVDGKVRGDMWIALPGTAWSLDQIEAKRDADRKQVHSRLARYDRDGLLLNSDAVEASVRDVDETNRWLPAIGRRLHFTFTGETAAVNPRGMYLGLGPGEAAIAQLPSQAATQPTDR